MDDQRFDAWSRALGAQGRRCSRRTGLRLLAGGGLVAVLGCLGESAAGKTKHKNQKHKKKSKPKPPCKKKRRDALCNASNECCSGVCSFGLCDCRKTSERCGADGECCSGICSKGGHCNCLVEGHACRESKDCCDTCQDGQCCRSTGSLCHASDECCSGVCDIVTGKCCGAIGSACFVTSDCCAADLVCRQSECVKNPCLSQITNTQTCSTPGPEGSFVQCCPPGYDCCLPGSGPGAGAGACCQPGISQCVNGGCVGAP